MIRRDEFIALLGRMDARGPRAAAGNAGDWLSQRHKL